jgi:hypothetical protein
MRGTGETQGALVGNKRLPVTFAVEAVYEAKRESPMDATRTTLASQPVPGDPGGHRPGEAPIFYLPPIETEPI